MKNITLFLPSLLIMLLSGCLGLEDDDEISGPTVSTASVTKENAGEVFSGFTLDLNPTIKFENAESASYVNPSDVDKKLGFQTVETPITGVSVKFGEVANGLSITFSHADLIEDIIIVLSGFKDIGNEGYIDEFTVEQATVGGKSINSPEVLGTKIIDQPMLRALEDRKNNLGENYQIPEIQDYNGSPTSEEWNEFVVGRAWLATEDYVTYLNITIVEFNSLTTGSYFNITGDSESSPGNTGTFTYSYDKTSDTTGTLVVTGIWTESDPDDKNYGDSIEQVVVRDVTFKNFFDVTYVESSNIETNLSTKAIISDDSGDVGKAEAITSAEIQLRKQKVNSAN